MYVGSNKILKTLVLKLRPASVSQDYYSSLPALTRQINFLVFSNEFGTNKTISVPVCVWSWAADREDDGVCSVVL